MNKCKLYIRNAKVMTLPSPLVLQGFKFTDSLLMIWKEKGWDITSLNNFLEKWLSMLLKLIDFTAENAAQCLQKFRSLKTQTTKEHKKTIPALVSNNLLYCLEI